MNNPFASRNASLAGPATDIMPVAPSDTVDLTYAAIALYVETGGTVSFITIANQTRSVKVADYSILPVGAKRIRATGTTATGIHAMVLA